mmetsp:Transcript_159082/g.305104  ORF Transcript_159082/g.305104 Transcript_159082/m.305104 type:complete len:195 (-) Transcript_159082:28-612(-)
MDQPISNFQPVYQFAVRWGCVMWTFVSVLSLFALMWMAGGVWALLRMELHTENLKGILGCFFFSIMSFVPASGFNYPVCLQLLYSSSDQWELVLSRRGRGPLTQPLSNLVGLIEVGWLGCSQSNIVGAVTASPGWGLLFEVNGEVVQWNLSLKDHEGFLKQLTNTCRDAGHTGMHNLLESMQSPSSCIELQDQS